MSFAFAGEAAAHKIPAGLTEVLTQHVAADSVLRRAHVDCWASIPELRWGKYLRPGFGDNLRVLEWILARCNNEVEAQKTAIGWVPKPEGLPLEGLNLPKKNLKKLLEVKKEKFMEGPGSL